MATQHKEVVSSKDSSETEIPGDTQEYSEKLSETPGTKGSYKQEDEDYDNLNYPPAWKYEKWFVGGYSQSRMIKFKKPKTMYTAINLFAGKNLNAIQLDIQPLIGTSYKVSPSCFTDMIRVSCPKSI